MARRDAWETLVCGDSGDLPFRLKDETGSLRIDPGGATFLGGESDVHHAESGGQHFRVTERLLPVGAHLFAVGTVDRVEAPRVPAAVTADALRKLRQDPAALARFDLDGNGRIDAEEWEVARQTVEAEAAAMTAPSTDTVVTMRRGRDGVLLVGDGSPSRSTQRLRLTAMGATALGVLAMLVGLFSLRGGA